jgi:MFS family permease
LRTTSPDTHQPPGPALQASSAVGELFTYKYYVLLVLVLSYVINVIDRGVYGAVLESIKRDLQLEDDLLGLVGGLAFALFYSTMGIPIARLADRWSRVNVLALSIALWSISTAGCGAATGFAMLFIARAATATGEAGGSPPSHSLISDYFPSSKRATALAIYAMSVPFGTSLGSLAAGHANLAFGWRTTFVVIGLPGLLVSLLVWFTIREPRRGLSDAPPHAKAPPPRLLTACRFLLTRNSFMHMSLAAALHSIVWYAGTNWNNAFFQRSHDLNSGEAGTYIAVFSLIGATGSFMGGFLADRLSICRNDKRWYMWVPGIACVAMVPVQFFAYLSSDLTLVVPVTFSLMFVLASMFFGPSFAVAQSVATVKMRAVSASVLLFIQTIIGLTLGPYVVGLISRDLAPTYGQYSLRYAMAVIGIVNLWAALHYFLGARRYAHDLAATVRLNAAQ